MIERISYKQKLDSALQIVPVAAMWWNVSTNVLIDH